MDDQVLTKLNVVEVICKSIVNSILIHSYCHFSPKGKIF